MCCNAFGLGALNVYWIIFGSAMLVLNGLSYDCTTSMAMFSGTTAYTCGSLENFLNGQWVIGFEGYFATAVALALMPKFVKDYPPAANKAVMMTFSVISVLTSLTSALAFFTPFELNGQPVDTTVPIAMTGVFMVLWLVAVFVHKEPETGKGLILN